MLRQPESRYEVGRSITLLKVKTFHDAEARVLEHLKGAGRHKGRLGALLVELANGTQFSVGTGFSDAERGAPPPVGSVITFRYQELSDGGVPRFPSYIGVRRDAVVATAPEGVAEPAKRSVSRRRVHASMTVASGPTVRAGRGIVEQVLGSGLRRLLGDRSLRPDRQRRAGQDEGFRERGTGPSPCHQVDRGKGCQGILRAWGGIGSIAVPKRPALGASGSARKWPGRPCRGRWPCRRGRRCLRGFARSLRPVGRRGIARRRGGSGTAYPRPARRRGRAGCRSRRCGPSLARVSSRTACAGHSAGLAAMTPLSSRRASAGR